MRSEQTCRMCGAESKLTDHHLLLKRSARRLGTNMTVRLCRSCHDGLHKGSPSERRVFRLKFWVVLTPEELDLIAQDPYREWWESRD